MRTLPKTVSTLSKPDRLLLLAFTLIVGATAIAAGLDLFSIGVFYLVATGAVTIAPLLRRAIGGRFDLFDPLVLFSFTYFMLFVVRPAYILAENVTEYSISYVPVNFSPEFTEMQFVALLGAVGAVVAYEFVEWRKWGAGSGAGRPRQPASWVAMAGVATSVVGLIGSYLFVSSIPGGLGTILEGRTAEYQNATFDISAYVYYAPLMLVPGALLFFGAWLSARKFWYLAGGLLAAIALIAVRGPVGGRLALVPLFLGAILLVYLVRKTRPRVLTVVAVLVVGMLGWSIIAQLRNNSVREDQGVETVLVDSLKAPQSAFEPFTEGHDAAMAPLLAAAMGVIPEKLGYGYGLTLLTDLATRGVPRSIWPDKPISSKEEITKELWPKQYAAHSANPEFSVLAVFYRELGAAGVLIGMLILGGLLSVVANYWRSRQDLLVIAVGYSIFFANIPMVIRDSPVDSLTRLVFTIGPVIVAGLVFARVGTHDRSDEPTSKDPVGQTSG